MKKLNSVALNMLEIEKELKIDYMNIPKVREFNHKLINVKFNDLKVIKLTKDQKERYLKANKIIVGESENYELVKINNTLQLVNKKTFEYRRIA